MASSFDGPAVTAAHRVQSLARAVQIAAPILAVLSVVGAVLLATRRFATQGCYRIVMAGVDAQLGCNQRSSVVIMFAVASELAVLFALLVVVLAARFAAFQAEVYLAGAERGAAPEVA